VGQGQQVLPGVPGGQDRSPDPDRECAQVVDHRVQVLGMHPGGGAGQPITQLPLPVALAAMPAPDLDGHPAIDLLIMRRGGVRGVEAGELLAALFQGSDLVCSSKVPSAPLVVRVRLIKRFPLVGRTAQAGG
jgi:hypothetical protein